MARKHVSLQCPNCLHRLDLTYQGELRTIKLADQEIDLRKRTDRPSYKAVLEASNVGDSWLLPPNRLAWWGMASSGWLKTHPLARIEEEKQPDGSVRFTRTA